MTEASAAAPAMAPVSRGERIHLIDALRGLAIFGILMVNMHYFAQPWTVLLATSDSPLIDRLAAGLITWFFTGKFYTLFSFLFGLGMAVQFARAQERGAKFGWFYARRLLILLVFGLLHAFLLWTGDILTSYALIGFVLLLFFRKTKPRTATIWAVILIVLPMIIVLAGGVLIEMASSVPEAQAQIDANFEQIAAKTAIESAEDIETYAEGSFVEITSARIEDTLGLLATVAFFQVPSILAMFLLGQAFYRAGRFENIGAQRGWWQRLALWMLPLGIVLNGVPSLYGFELSEMATAFNLRAALLAVMSLLGGPVLSLGYVAGLTLLWERGGAFQRALALLTPVGRMALSNYLTHSIVFTTIFYGYGLGFFGQLGPALGILLTLGLYLLQIPLSHWWMGRFRFGPFEWLWRSATYLKAQPMRLGAPDASGA